MGKPYDHRTFFCDCSELSETRRLFMKLKLPNFELLIRCSQYFFANVHSGFFEQTLTPSFRSILPMQNGRNISQLFEGPVEQFGGKV
jgi:hypothetical protein